ncbi:hypothetical protein H1C71_032231, partial [Ictidomys tridecemlineatus]
MAELLNSILNVIKVFQTYAKENCTSLSKKELKQLLLTEFGDILQRPNDPKTVENILTLLDQDLDGQVDFQEYLLLVFQLVQVCHRKLGKKSCGHRTSQQEEGQEVTQDAGRTHRQKHEGERQNPFHHQSERQSQDAQHNQSERKDRDFHHGPTERQGQDFS